jgi:hypothetical protein
MNPLRHIAAFPTEKEQRCIRCCEVLLRKGASSTGPAWPGSYVVAIADKIFSGHVAAAVNDCQAVDLCDEPREVAEGVAV